jgi:peptidoglycan hydrolase-like protein with peptidoglycan-binding domain
MNSKRLLPALILLMVCVALPSFGEQATVPVVTPAPTYSPEQWLQLWYQIGDMLRANGTYPFVELKKGDSGNDVRALQTRLAELGYYSKKVVDEFGAGTYTAMRLFERANDLSVNGIASVRDQKLLFSHLALASDGTTPEESGDASATATASPEETSHVYVSIGLHTLNPDILEGLVATATPTIFIPDFTLPDLQVPSL